MSGFSITLNGAAFPPENWYFDRADQISTTGRGVSMAIGMYDRLVLGYIQEAGPPDFLKIAIQNVQKNFVPITRK
jgi:hypothetical protein